LKKSLPHFTIASFSIYLVLTILLLSCSSPKELEYREIRNFKVDKLGLKTSTLKTDLVFFNPNSFGLQLKKFDLDVFIDNNYLGHTTHDQLVSIPKNSEFAIPVKMDVEMKNLVKNGFNALVSKEVTLKVVGTIRAGNGTISKNFPVNYEMKQNFSLF
jgi:LEA14-like dessication related protein